MFAQQLSQALSKKVIDSVVESVIDNPDLFDELEGLIYLPDSRTAWRAAWALAHMCSKDVSFFTPERLEKLSVFLLRTDNEGIQRSLLSIILKSAWTDFPVEMINRCFEWMLSPQKPPAIQVYSMYILVNLCKKYPEFTEELILSLENGDDSFYTKGFASAKRKTIKKLKSLHGC